MARTPLFDRFRRAEQLRRASRRTGIPATELAAQRRERVPISRRGFLKSTAVAGVASFAAACGNDQDATPESGSVVIVGGGIAGLHCAYRLRQAGLNPYLFDARSRLGGRVLTDRTSFPGGQHADLGGERIDSNHVTMLDLAEELDLELVDYDTVDPALSRFTAFFDGRFLAESEILDGYAPIGDAIEGALSTLEDPVAQISYRNPNGAEPLDALSICLLYTSPSPRDRTRSRMPSSA